MNKSLKMAVILPLITPLTALSARAADTDNLAMVYGVPARVERCTPELRAYARLLEEGIVIDAVSWQEFEALSQ